MVIQTFGNFVGINDTPNPLGYAPSEMQLELMEQSRRAFADISTGEVDRDTALMNVIIEHSPILDGTFGHQLSIRDCRQMNMPLTEIPIHLIDLLLAHYVDEEKLQRIIKGHEKRKSDPLKYIENRTNILDKLFRK